MRNLLGSLKGRLMAVAGVSCIALLLAEGYSVLQYRDAILQEVEREAAALASTVALQSATYFEGVEAVLQTAARDRVIAASASASCTARLAELDDALRDQGYSRFAVLDPDGRIHCAGVALDGFPDRSDRLYYQNVIRTGRFSLGAYVFGPISQETIVVAAQPVFDENGEMSSILAVGVSASWLEDLLSDFRLADGTRLRLIDTNGTVAARFPADPDTTGVALDHPDLLDELQRRSTGVAHLSDPDGLLEIVAWTPIAEDLGGLTVAAHYPMPGVLDWIGTPSGKIHLPLAMALFLVIVAFTISIDRTIVRGIRDIGELANRLAAGDFTARMRLQTIGREFSDLSGGLNAMASAIENRDTELKGYNSLLEDLNKRNRDLSNFANIASHDLRAPLRGIHNLVDWIEEDIEEHLSDDSRNNMERLRLRVKRLDEMLDGLLRYSLAGRTDQAEALTDTRELVNEAVNMLDPADGFEVIVDGPLPAVYINRDALLSVFVNLIGNAIKHHDRDRGRVVVSGRLAGDKVEYTVTDDGPGIPDHSRDSVFDIFRTLDKQSSQSNTGIGLAIVKRLVQEKGGSIEVLPSILFDRGTTFRFHWKTRPTSM